MGTLIVTKDYTSARKWIKERPGYLKKSVSITVDAIAKSTGKLIGHTDVRNAIKSLKGSLSSKSKAVKTPKKEVKITRVTPKNIGDIKDFKRKNRIFNNWPRDKKRVAVAYDIIRAIESNNIKPKRGMYIFTTSEYNNKIDFSSDTNNNQAILCNTNQNLCSVCAIGAIFVSKIRLGNNFGSDIECTSGNEMITFTKDIFTLTEMRMFENYFEHTATLNLSDSEVLISMMNNIIRNKGKFNSKEENEFQAKHRF